jgi:hypothetical protein
MAFSFFSQSGHSLGSSNTCTPLAEALFLHITPLYVLGRANFGKKHFPRPKVSGCLKSRTPDTHGQPGAVPLIILVFGWRRCDNYSPRYSTLGTRSSSSVLTCSLSQWLVLMCWRNALWGPTEAMLFHNSHTVRACFGEKPLFPSESVRNVPFFSRTVMICGQAPPDSWFWSLSRADRTSQCRETARCAAVNAFLMGGCKKSNFKSLRLFWGPSGTPGPMVIRTRLKNVRKTR